MTLQERGQQQVMDRQRNTSESGNQQTQPIPGSSSLRLFPQTRYGIVDGEFVEVLGQDNLPGMSPVLWCVGISGIYVAVPTREVQHFATPAQAIQLLQNQVLSAAKIPYQNTIR